MYSRFRQAPDRVPILTLNGSLNDLSGPQLVKRLRGALQRRPPADWNTVSIRTPLLSNAGRT